MPLPNTHVAQAADVPKTYVLRLATVLSVPPYVSDFREKVGQLRRPHKRATSFLPQMRSHLAIGYDTDTTKYYKPKGLLRRGFVKVRVVEQKVGGKLFVLVTQHVGPQHRLSVEAQGFQLG